MIFSHGMLTDSSMFRPSLENICCFCLPASSVSLCQEAFVFFHDHYSLSELMPAD